MDRKIKVKRCKQCGNEFQQYSSIQKWCSASCGYELSQQIQKKASDKAWRKEKKQRKDKLKSKSGWLSDLQTVVNKYVRLRDKGLPCISCDKPDDGTHQRHASHHKSVGSNSALRFNLWNIHASCSQCNNHLSGNIGEYIPRLIAKIGQDKYDWLLTQNHTVKYDIEHIKRFKKIFNKRIRIMEKRI